ncbi:MAG: AsmA family protein, partial [Planctomycetota bacterium]|nr:AsmA family protein [Planctomycetota bacterium]
AQVFPGALTPDLGLRGKLEGRLVLGSEGADLAIREGRLRFQDFHARLGGNLSIPSGTAELSGILTPQLERQPAAAGQDSPYAALTLVDFRNGRAALAGALLDGKPIDELAGEFQLENGLLTLRAAKASLAGGEARMTGTVDFKPLAPAARLRLALRNMPLSLANDEMAEYLSFEKGELSLPADPSQPAEMAFSGFSEAEILQTLRLGNFNFATGPVTLSTGPVLNAELDKARGLMRQDVSGGGKTRVITLTSVTGSANAAGDGILAIPAERPILVTGDNTGDFRVQGRVSGDRSLDLDFFVAGKLENLIGFTLPNIIPNLRNDSDESKSRFMERMNRNAAAGHYVVKVSGSLDSPNLSGIGLLAGRFLTDIVAAAPAEILGGAVDLVKNAPGALINAPQNLGRGLGRVLGGLRPEGAAEPAPAPDVSREEAPVPPPPSSPPSSPPQPPEEPGPGQGDQPQRRFRLPLPPPR